MPPCGCGSTSPTTAAASTAGPRQPGLRTVQGELEEALDTVLRVEAVVADRAPAAPTPACTRAVRSRTSTSTSRCSTAAGPRRGQRRRRPAAPAQRRAARRRAGAPGRGGAGRLRRALLGALAPLRLPDRRPARRRSTRCARSHVLVWPRPLDEAADERGRGGAARASTTSRRSAASARAPRRSAPCSTSRWARRRRRAAGRRRCGPTPSATTWCAPWSAAWSRSARAVGTPAWAAERPGRPAARPGGDRRARRTGSRSRRSATRADDELARAGRTRARVVTDPVAEHYFSADPSVPFTRAPVAGDGVGARPGAEQRVRRLRAGPARHRDRGAVPRDRAAGDRAATSTSAAGTA